MHDFFLSSNFIISTQKSCRICTTRVKKFPCLPTFVKTVRRWIQLKEQGCQILWKVVGHRSLSIFASKSQFGIAELNENGLQKLKTVLKLRRTCTTCYARGNLLSKTEWGWKNQVSSFFFAFVTSTENKEKRKMSQMNGDQCRYLFKLTTAIAASFSVARSMKPTEKRLAHVRKWWG